VQFLFRVGARAGAKMKISSNQFSSVVLIKSQTNYGAFHTVQSSAAICPKNYFIHASSSSSSSARDKITFGLMAKARTVAEYDIDW
jgi:hypothetical protein